MDEERTIRDSWKEMTIQGQVKPQARQCPRNQQELPQLRLETIANT